MEKDFTAIAVLNENLIYIEWWKKPNDAYFVREIKAYTVFFSDVNSVKVHDML